MTPAIYVTENGISLHADAASDAQYDTVGCHAPRPTFSASRPAVSPPDIALLSGWQGRLMYLFSYLSAMHSAIEDGADVRGYFAW